MKSRTLTFATLLLVTAFLLMQAIASHAALANVTWTNTPGGGTSDTSTFTSKASSANARSPSSEMETCTFTAWILGKCEG